MTTNEATTHFRLLRDAPFDDAVLKRWIWEIDAMALDEVISKCSDVARGYPLGDDEELLIAFPDDEVYFLYLSMKCDLIFGDGARYNVSALAFENAWKAFAERYFRNHLPKKADVKIGGRIELFQN